MSRFVLLAGLLGVMGSAEELPSRVLPSSVKAEAGKQMYIPIRGAVDTEAEKRIQREENGNEKSEVAVHKAPESSSEHNQHGDHQ